MTYSENHKKKHSHALYIAWFGWQYLQERLPDSPFNFPY